MLSKNSSWVFHIILSFQTAFKKNVSLHWFSVALTKDKVLPITIHNGESHKSFNNYVLFSLSIYPHRMVPNHPTIVFKSSEL